MSDRAITCETCRYSEMTVLADGPQIECRRYPPVIAFDGADLTRLFPQVDANEWCGEYDHRPLRLPEVSS